MAKKNGAKAPSVATSKAFKGSTNLPAGKGVRGMDTRFIVLYGPPGCLDAETHIHYSVRDLDGKRQNKKGGSIEQLYHRFNHLPKPGKGAYQRPQTVKARFFAPSMDEDGRIFHNEIEAVIDSGVKPCVEILTRGGLRLVCTVDHPLATPNSGFVPVRELHVGAEISVHRNVHWTSSGARSRRINRPEILVKTHPRAAEKTVSTSSGEYTYKRLSRARAVFEAHLNGLDLPSYVARLNGGFIEGLKFAPSGCDIHHSDENPLNDVPDNLVALPSADHAREHMVGPDGRPRLAHIAVDDEIVSIESVGDRYTYDICMKQTPHNFVAAGFVVHNSGKTHACAMLPTEGPAAAKWIVTDPNCVPTLQTLDRLPEASNAWDVKSLHEVKECLNAQIDACEKGDSWSATVLDSFTTMSHWHQADVARAHGQSYMGENAKDNGWAHFNAEVGSIIDHLAALSRYVNVIVIAHAKEKFDNKGTWSGLNLPGSNAERLAQAANWVLFTSMSSYVVEPEATADEYSEIVDSNGSPLKITREIHTRPLGSWITKVNARNLRTVEPMDMAAMLKREGML